MVGKVTSKGSYNPDTMLGCHVMIQGLPYECPREDFGGEMGVPGDFGTSHSLLKSNSEY